MTYEEQLSAAKFRAERDQARQELDRFRDDVEKRKRAAAAGVQNVIDRYERICEDRRLKCEKASGDSKRRGKEIEHLCDVISSRNHEIKALRQRISGMEPRLMPEGYEWSDGFAGAVDFFEAMHDLIYTIEGEEHTGPEMVRDVMARLLPKGMEWPRYESGEPVRFGDETNLTDAVESITFNADGTTLIGDKHGDFDAKYVQCVKRPILAADNEPLEAGQTVWHVGNGIEFTVVGLPESSEYQAVKLRLDDGAFTGLDPDQLTHQRPVLDADGVLIKKGDTVYGIETGNELVVDAFVEDGSHGPYTVDCHFAVGGEPNYYRPDKLTHTKPEPQDSWERIEDDAAMQPYAYCVGNGLFEECDETETIPTNELFARDLVRRCKALAGVSE